MEDCDPLRFLPGGVKVIVSSYFGLVASALTDFLPHSYFTLWDVIMFLTDVADGDGSTFKSYLEAFHRSVPRVSYDREFIVLTDDLKKRTLSPDGNLVFEYVQTGCILWALTYSTDSTSFRTLLEMARNNSIRVYFYTNSFGFPQDMLEQKDWRETARNVISQGLGLFDVKGFMENVFLQSPGAISKEDYIKYEDIIMHIGGDYRSQYCTYFSGDGSRKRMIKKFQYSGSSASPILREMGIVLTDLEIIELDNQNLLGEERIRRLRTDLEYLTYFICIPYSYMLEGPLTGELRLHVCNADSEKERGSFIIKYVEHHIAAGSVPTEEQRLKIISVLPLIQEYFSDIVKICILFDIDLGPHIIKHIRFPTCESCRGSSWHQFWIPEPHVWIEALAKRPSKSSRIWSNRTRISGNATTFISSLLSICSEMKTLSLVKKYTRGDIRYSPCFTFSRLLAKHASYINLRPPMVKREVKKTLRDHEPEDIKDKRICRTRLFVASHFPTRRFHHVTRDYRRRGESPLQFVVSLDNSELFDFIYLESFAHILHEYVIPGNVISLFRRGENKYCNGRKDLKIMKFDSLDREFDDPEDVILEEYEMSEEEEIELRDRLDKYPALKKEIGIAWRKERRHDRSPTNSGILLDILCTEKYYWE